MRNPLFYCFLNYIHTCPPVTTPYLYSMSVLYSHSLMKVAVQSLKRLKYCKMRASAYQRIMTDLPSHSGLYKRVKETIAYYRQGANSEPMPADMLMERLRDKSVRSGSVRGLHLGQLCVMLVVACIASLLLALIWSS